jgi:hypothetical protein
MNKLPDRRLLLNGRTVSLISFIVIIVILILVFLSFKCSIYDELEITIGIIGLALFTFLTYGLYNSLSIINKPIFPKLKEIDFSKLDLIGDVPDLVIGFEEGILGIIGAIILWIVITIVAFALITFVFTVLWSAILILTFVLYWLFFRAMRLVFLKSSKCKGNLGLSIKYSFIYTFLYTGWIFGIIMISKYFAERGL